MPRPSKNIDVALLRAGRALFPQAGCAGLSVRAVAEQAGANIGMFHYHFKTKENFLRTLLQQVYEEVFAGVYGAADDDGPAVERLRRALNAAGALLVTHRKVIARVWMDAVGGEPVAADFLQRNAPRHIGVLLGLIEQAQAEGAISELPPLQCMAVLMGSVGLPVVFASGLVEVAVPVAAFRRQFQQQVMSAQGIAQRVDVALAALAPRHGVQAGATPRVKVSRAAAAASGGRRKESS
jgi:AcrR family transcriptional regulator